MNTSKRSMLGLLGGAALMPLWASANTYRTPMAPTGPQATTFPNFVLEAHDGRKLRFYDDMLKNKIVVIGMMYTSCSGVCPGNFTNLMLVQEMLGNRVGKDIFMYSLSLQPEFDRPEALKAYAKQRDLKPGWTLLTGKPPEIEQLRRKMGFYDSDPVADADLSNHAGVVRIGNVARDRWFMLPSMSSAKMIARAILEL
jgi:protein SCO1